MPALLSVATRSSRSSACSPRLTGVCFRLSSTYSASVCSSMVSSVFVDVSPSMVITVQSLMLSESPHAQMSLASLTSRFICCVVLLWLSVCSESAISATSLQGRKQSIFSLIVVYSFCKSARNAFSVITSTFGNDICFRILK